MKRTGLNIREFQLVLAVSVNFAHFGLNENFGLVQDLQFFFFVIFEIKEDTFGICLPGLSSMVLPPVFVKASSKHKHIGLLEPRRD